MLTIPGPRGADQDLADFRAMAQQPVARCLVMGAPGRDRRDLAELAEQVARNHAAFWKVVWLKDAKAFLRKAKVDTGAWGLKPDTAAVFLGPVNRTVQVMDEAACDALALSQAFSDAQ